MYEEHWDSEDVHEQSHNDTASSISGQLPPYDTAYHDIDNMTYEAIEEMDVDDLDSLNIPHDFSVRAPSVTDSVEVPKRLEELQESNMSSMDMNLCEKQPTLGVSIQGRKC